MKPLQRKLGGLILATLLVTLCSQAQTNITVQPPVLAADHTAKISWNSETGAVYQVWAADSLTDAGNQGLQWILREANCASKGPNAEWMDVGNPLWIPRILAPRFQPMRFYRVEKIKQATMVPPPIVTVALTQTNSIRGDLYATVHVSLLDTNQQLSDVGLFVDGQKLYTVAYDSFTAFINSCEWPNGPHEIYAVATMVDAGETLPDCDRCTDTNAANIAIGVSASQFVTFSNYISQFFVAVPFFDPSQGQTQEVVAVFPEPTCWRLTVLNYLDQGVRQFTGTSSSLYAAWDGTDSSGTPLPFGFYDYLIEARPSQYGCPTGSGPSMAAFLGASSSSAGSQTNALSAAAVKAGLFAAEAMQFNAGNTFPENISIPTINPTNPPTGTNDGAGSGRVSAKMALSLAGYPTSAEEALSQSLTSYYVAPPPMPPVITNIGGVRHAVRWEDVYGPQPPIEIHISETQQEAFLRKAAGITPVDGPQPLDDWSDQTYTTRTPNRVPGNLFMGYAGTVGVGWQGHHPTGPNVDLPPGLVISASHPPYGPIASASTIANFFVSEMGRSGWRTAFNLGNDNFSPTNLVVPAVGGITGISGYATKCNFGMYVGHMTATSYTDPNFGCTHSWFPIYNSAQPGSYRWIALPACDFGPPNGASPLLWMAMYGCNSLQSRDWNDMWSKFLLPFPPNLRLLLGSEEGIFLHPIFGWQFAGDLNGSSTPGNSPMTIAASWYDAAAAADQQTAKSIKWRTIGLGTRHMSVCYRDNSSGGPKTIADTIWSWSSNISYDWFDVSLDEQQVYP